MNNNVLVALLIGLLAGIGTTVGVAAINDDTPNNGHSSMSMDEMTEALEDLEGDDFDRAFTEMMIVHHEGAIDMAELIDGRAKQSELKELGEEIITAQTREVKMMQGWLKDWGYDDGRDMHEGMMHN